MNSLLSVTIPITNLVTRADTNEIRAFGLASWMAHYGVSPQVEEPQKELASFEKALLTSTMADLLAAPIVKVSVVGRVGRVYAIDVTPYGKHDPTFPLVMPVPNGWADIYPIYQDAMKKAGRVGLIHGNRNDAISAIGVLEAMLLKSGAFWMSREELCYFLVTLNVLKLQVEMTVYVEYEYGGGY